MVNAQVEVPFTPRLDNSYINIKGDYTFLSNSIINRVDSSNTANDPYNGNSNNNGFHRDYIDIDGDPTTFSSSSSTLALPFCSRIYYAGLYWSANYQQEVLNNSQIPSLPANDTRRLDFTQIKFRMPGGAYIDITADNNPDPVGEEDDIIYDNVNFKDSPYTCYRNVTSLLQGLADPNGEYFVGNVRATRGRSVGGAGGWTLVVIYENPTLTGKYISVFDGYAGVNGNATADVNISGFNTIPVGPVNARLGASVVEGDRSISGDAFRIETPLNPGFTNLTNGSNPANNFFNSNITIDGADVTTRDIYATNTLGFDSDIFIIDNPGNNIIANNETDASLRLFTQGDAFGAFLITFGVEIIEPNIVLEKRVEDIAGNDITGLGVNLGQELDYILSFRNTGNDDATNYVIRDILPINTTFLGVELGGNTDITYTYNAATRELLFQIPDRLVEEGDPSTSIRINVRVAENCFDFIDACTDQIENIAFSTYQGVINDNEISDDPSVSDFDSCGFTTPGATNFLLDDLESCDFTRTVQLCGEDVLLDAGNGFDAYTWYEDVNNNQLIDAGDVVITDNDADNDPSTILVNDTGTYIVDKDVADPCKGFQEVIIVTLFGTTQTNPITGLINDTTNTVDGEVLICSNDGEELPQIFLCGQNDAELIQINIPDAEDIFWEQLDESSCSAATPDCANKNNTCTWNQVGSGSDFLADAAGEYRLVINYQNGCFSRFYFNVFQNPLDPQFNSTDIICGSPGTINVTNMPASYEFQLVDTSTNTVVVPFGNNPSFSIANNGIYRVEMRQQGITDGCIFVLDNIGIEERNFQVDVAATDTNCNGLGTISISVLDVEPQYYYQISQGGSVVDTHGPTNDNNYRFENLNAGTYDVEVTTDDGCLFNGQQIINDTPDITVNAQVTKNIDCTDGTITLTGAGGFPNPNYFYAIWAYNGATTYTTISDIPASEFQTNNQFTISNGDEGDYQFVIVDNNNCWALSNEVTVINQGPLAITSSSTPIVCSGSNTASITINASGADGGYEYSIDDGVTYQTSNTFAGLSANTYPIRVRSLSGCEVTDSLTITNPLTLSASAAVTELAECNPGVGAEVRITNPIGGVAPYEYSFDGGVSFSTNPIANLLPGTHSLLIRDANGCEFPMNVVVEPEPTAPNLTASIVYECDGEGTVTVTPDNANYFYTYELNGSPNTPADSNVFTNVSAGFNTISVNYIRNTPPPQSELFDENFGAGANTAITEIDPVYCYEPQQGITTSCADGGFINDGEYSVTNTINPAYGGWRIPNDHSGITDGRFLVINVGGVAGVGGVIYRKDNLEVIPNRNITISLWAFNLLRDGINGGDPSIEIQLVDPSNNIIASTVTGNIPKNLGPDDWQAYLVNLNPGPNSNLDIVIRTNSNITQGNDIAIDDIRAYQTPEVCPNTATIDVLVEAGNALDATITAASNNNCFGDAMGIIDFDVINFNTTHGYIYAVNGAAFSSAQFNSSISIPNLAAGNYTISVRDALDSSCEIVLNQTITEPTPVVASASVTAVATCTNGGGTITASATGGTPNYQYELQDDSGTVISGFDFATNGANTVFSSLPAGSYVILAQDANGCVDPIDTAIIINDPNPISFTATATACYSGANDGSIQVSVTDGNGNYQFSLNGGPFVSPSPTNSLNYTFNNLGAGSYTVDVMDQFGCVAPQQTVTINPQLNGSATLTADLTCLANASVTVNATGGSGTYSYEWSNDGGATFASTNFSGNVFSTNTFGTFLFRITDTTTPTACQAITNSVEITEAETPVISTVVPTNILCYNEQTGSLAITIDTTVGLAPYTISVLETNTSTNYGSQVNGLPAGDYQVTITDAKGCVSNPYAVSISQPNPITYTTTDVPITCNGSGGILEGSISVSSISGGTAEYTYYLTSNNGTSSSFTTTPSNRDHTFTILEFGIYQVDVVDANGCSSFTTEIIASPPSDLDIDVSTLTTDCLLGGTAEVSVSSGLGSGTYEFAILESYSNPYSSTYINPDTPGGSTATFNGLTPGVTYTFVVHDTTTNCYYFEEAAAPINTPSNMSATLDAVNNVSCTGSADGNISFTFTGYDALATGVNYEVFNRQSNISTGFTGTSSVNPPTTVSVTNFATLPPGEYYLLLTEVGGPNNGCSVDGGAFTIRESTNLLSVDVASPTNDNCAVNAGVITAIGRFGTAPYEYQYLDASLPAPTALSAGWVTDTFANVESGNYIVYVKDAYGCVQQQSITVNLDPNPDISVTVVDECVAEGTFEVLITLNNSAAAIAPFALSVNGGPSQNITFNASNQYTVSGLSSGVAQTFTITDANGCSDSENTTIYPPLQFGAQLTKLLDCSASPNAEITINITNGSGNYDYEITGPVNQIRTNTGGNTLTWNNANAAGTYTITVYDNATSTPNCLFSIPVTVPAIVTPTIQIDNTIGVSCQGASDGQLMVSTTDLGNGPYSFEIIAASGGSTTLPVLPTSSTATTATFSNLEGSLIGIDYTIQVTAAATACTETTIATITEPAAITNITATVTPFECAVGNTAINALVEVDNTTITGGSNNYVIYEFIDSSDNSVLQTGSNTQYVETDYNGRNLIINVYDSNGCVGSTTATVAPFDELLAPSLVIDTPISCVNNETITITANGSLSSSAVSPHDYRFRVLPSGAWQTNGTFSNLSSGNYLFEIENTTTNCTSTIAHTVNEPNTFSIDVTVINNVSCFGTDSGQVSFELLDAVYIGGFDWRVFDTNGTPSLLTDDIEVLNGTSPTNGPTAPINIGAGNYYVEINQSGLPNCTNIQAFTITGPTSSNNS